MASPPSQYGAISTHVSVRRRTKHTFSPYYMMRNFNSRLRKETNFNVPIAALLSIISIHVSVRRRTQKSNLHYIYIKISTHVSVRRRTVYRKLRKIQENFNSRLRKETNLLPLLLQLVDFAFQFTSPQGDEQFRQIVRKFVVIFQFTSPQGDELATLLLIYRILYISIHVSARRRTFFPWHFFLLNAFQFTSPQGDELSADLTPRYKTNFNSRLRKETNSEKNQYA